VLDKARREVARFVLLEVFAVDPTHGAEFGRRNGYPCSLELFPGCLDEATLQSDDKTLKPPGAANAEARKR